MLKKKEKNATQQERASSPAYGEASMRAQLPNTSEGWRDEGGESKLPPKGGKKNQLKSSSTIACREQNGVRIAYGEKPAAKQTVSESLKGDPSHPTAETLKTSKKKNRMKKNRSRMRPRRNLIL